MTPESSKRPALAVAAMIFMVAAAFNFLMLLDIGANSFSIIAVMGFALGVLLLFVTRLH